MADAASTTTDPFEIATEAAIADIRAALDATLPVEGEPPEAQGEPPAAQGEPPAAQGEPPEQPAAAAPGEAFGHGVIRLRGQSRPSTAHTTTTPDPGPAPAGPVGHGTIRLRG